MVEVAAYYFPNYHPDPRNDAWHGKGWTEWDLLRAAKPRYPGHQQPKVPAWGEFDESDPAWAAKEIDLAADHGLTAFLYDWYWYEDGPYLNGGLEKGFLKAPNNSRMKFALMWANHDWFNIMPADHLNKPAKLASGHLSPAGMEKLADYVCENYFSKPNYLCFDGQPYFSVYEVGTLLAGLGGLDAACRALDRFRARVKAAGFPGLHLNLMEWGFSVLPAEVKVESREAVAESLGASSIGTYAWVHHYDPDRGGFPQSSYAVAAEANFKAWEDCSRRFKAPYHPNVSMGWDPSPRTCGSDKFEARGYPWTAILEGNSPAAFKSALEKARAFMDRQGHAGKMLTLNAWNEWTEGSYLLPDKLNGMAYLEAVKSIFGGRK